MNARQILRSSVSSLQKIVDRRQKYPTRFDDPVVTSMLVEELRKRSEELHVLENDPNSI